MKHEEKAEKIWSHLIETGSTLNDLAFREIKETLIFCEEKDADYSVEYGSFDGLLDKLQNHEQSCRDRILYAIGGIDLATDRKDCIVVFTADEVLTLLWSLAATKEKESGCGNSQDSNIKQNITPLV